MPNDNDNDELLRLACQAVDWADEHAKKDPQLAVAAQALRFRSIFREDSYANKVLSSVVIPARFEGCALEETSNRMRVAFTALSDVSSGAADDPISRPPAPERLRTPRLESSEGFFLAARLKAFKPGDRVVVYKYLEKAPNGRKYRLLTWIERA